MDREAWQATVHGVTKSGTQLSDCTHTHRHTHKMRRGSRNASQINFLEPELKQQRLQFCGQPQQSTESWSLRENLDVENNIVVVV